MGEVRSGFVGVEQPPCSLAKACGDIRSSCRDELVEAGFGVRGFVIV